MHTNLYLGLFVITLPCVALSVDNYCREKIVPIDRLSQFCHGQTIPASKSRNFISEQLLCGSGRHSHTRNPVDFDEENWRDTLNIDPEAARNMLRKLPVPLWSGVVKYDSYLHWSWEACREVVSAAECGMKEVCQTHEKDDKKTRICHHEVKSCYTDVVVSESVFCNNEQLDYDVEFIPVADDDDTYPPRLANGYDLLPGETEGIEINNGAWLNHLARMQPKLAFREPRNKYQVDRMSSDSYDPSDLLCQEGRVHHIGFYVLPLGRTRSRSGNGFQLPTSFDNEALDPLVWQSAINIEGQRQPEGYPAVLRLQDYTAVAMNEFALDSGDLFKNLVVRIQLYDQSSYALLFAQSTIYIEEQNGVKQTINALSEKQNIRRSYLWEIMLETNSVDPRRNLYRSFIPWFVYFPARLLLPAKELSYERHLHPGIDYQLRLTVYQRESSIYYQSCEDDPEALDCQYYLGAGWFNPQRYESGYYSDANFDVVFTSPANVNLRTWWATFWDSVAYLDDLAFVAGVIFSTHYTVKRQRGSEK